MSDIFTASLTGDCARVAALVQSNPKLVWASNDRKRTALHYAAREGHVAIVQTLLEAGANPDCVVYPNKEITLPITLAHARGHDHVVALLDDWADQTKPETTSSLGEELCAAVRTSDMERFRELTTLTGAVAATDGHGNSALHVAADLGHRQLVLALLDLGADPDARNKRDFAPIHLALTKSAYDDHEPDQATAGLLLGRGAQFDLWSACALGELAMIIKLAAVMPAAIHRDHPSYPITIAAQAGQLMAVQWLLDNGADPNAPRVVNPESSEPYHEHGAPLLFATLKNHSAVVHALLAAGANPNTTLMATASAPSEAYQRGYDDIAALLFKYGGIPDTGSCLARGNYAAVLQAFQYDPGAASKSMLRCGDADLVRICLQHEPTLTASEQFGVLFGYMRVNSDDIVRARKHSDIMCTLFEYGFDPNGRDQENMSLLHRSVGCMWRERWMNSQEVMIQFTKVLLDHGATINAKDDDLRSTPVAWHARYGHEKVVGYLLSRGAATELADDESWATPLAWATMMGHPRVVEVLQAAGPK